MTDPIDADVPIPAPEGQDPDYLTRDIVSALERAVMAKVERTAHARHIGKRRAAMLVLRELA